VFKRDLHLEEQIMGFLFHMGRIKLVQSYILFGNDPLDQIADKVALILFCTQGFGGECEQIFRNPEQLKHCQTERDANGDGHGDGPCDGGPANNEMSVTTPDGRSTHATYLLI